MTNDPVCGMQIDESKAAGSTTYGGQTFYFCSTACKQKFDANPQQYAGEAAHAQHGGQGHR